MKTYQVVFVQEGFYLKEVDLPTQDDVKEEIRNLVHQLGEMSKYGFTPLGKPLEEGDTHGGHRCFSV